jgi:hypothetical protein
MSETKLSASIASALTGLGYPVVRVQSGTVRAGGHYIHMADRGTPDRIVLLRGGKVLWLEVKTPSGMLSADQVVWHCRAAKLGHHVRVVRNVSEAIEAVREVEG